jgi:hypothetical protein
MRAVSGTTHQMRAMKALDILPIVVVAGRKLALRLFE